jgi:hypothetical protein
MNMKARLKTAIAAVALAFAGSASAGIVNGTGTIAAQQAGSELWLTVFSDSLGKSYSRDLGFLYRDFLPGGTVRPNDVTAGSGVDYAFAANATPTVAGNVLAAGYKLVFGADPLAGLSAILGAVDAVWSVTGFGVSGILTTSNLASVAAPSGNVATAVSKGQTYLGGVAPSASGVNQFMPAGNSVASNGSHIYTAADSGYSEVTGWENDWGSSVTFSNRSTVGDSMNFFQLLTASNTTNTYTNATWTLNGDGTLVYEVTGSPVPVPLPLALMASGLLLMGGIARRRKQA